MERAQLLDLLGPLPEGAALEASVLERVECDGYVREKVEYSVELGERVRAYLLIPKSLDRPAPAVFCHHQHHGAFHLGKSEVVGLEGDSDQAYAAELAQRGYVTFAPDAIAFEERNWSDRPGWAGYFEFTSRLVAGRNLLAKALHDVSVGLDFVAGRSEVDANRLGFIGHSYGGRMAIWAAALDERIKASVSNCGCVNYKDSLVRDTGIQMEFCLPGLLEVGDLEDVVKLIAPRALLLQATEEDKWSRGAEAMFQYAKDAFPDGRIEIAMWPGAHVFTARMRETAYGFLDRNLLGGPRMR